jgi:hypothetical protein
LAGIDIRRRLSPTSHGSAGVVFSFPEFAADLPPARNRQAGIPASAASRRPAMMPRTSAWVTASSALSVAPRSPASRRFLGGEFGQQGDPDGLAATFRGVLTAVG